MRANISLLCAAVFVGCAVSGYPIPALLFGTLFVVTDGSVKGV